MFKVRVFDGYEEPKKLVDESVIVESAGYVPRQKTIENLIFSGQRLIQSRMEEFDGETVDKALENASIVRVHDLDIVDSVDYLHRLQDNTEVGENGTNGGVSMSVNNKSESVTPDLSNGTE